MIYTELQINSSVLAAAFPDIFDLPKWSKKGYNSVLQKLPELHVTWLKEHYGKNVPYKTLADVYDVSTRRVILAVANCLHTIRIAGKYDWFGDKFVIKMDHDIDVLGLSQRQNYALQRAGCNTVFDLVILSKRDLARLPGVGKKTVEDVISSLAQYDLELLPDY